ncbi:MAG TPA: hypothetical protein VL979_06935 [Solirubrobacteraceae bacterium]|nr:hypothetical protein [Solirubrobacteraceae bacterium]
MAGAGGTVIIPWYATGFRGDGFERALNEVAAAALRYGASSYAVYRSREDRYRFQQLAAFDEYMDWERYWDGAEMTYFRATHSSWYQVPVLYGWWDLTTHGAVIDAAPLGAADGHGNGAPVGDIT